MDERQLRREWDSQQRGDSPGTLPNIKFSDVIGFILIVLGVSVSFWILLVIKDILNGEELGLMKGISQEIMSYKDRHNDIAISLPGKSLGILLAGCLLFVATIIAICFINQGVIMMHTDVLKIVRKIDNLKETLLEIIRNRNVNLVNRGDPK